MNGNHVDETSTPVGSRTGAPRSRSRDVEGTPDDGPARRLGDFADSVSNAIRHQPAMTVFTAMALGFIVGGGLTFRAGRFALTAAARWMGRELLKQVL